MLPVGKHNVSELANLLDIANRSLVVQHYTASGVFDLSAHPPTSWQRTVLLRQSEQATLMVGRLSRLHKPLLPTLAVPTMMDYREDPTPLVCSSAPLCAEFMHLIDSSARVTIVDTYVINSIRVSSMMLRTFS